MGQSTSNTIVDIRNITAWRGRTRVFRDFSLELERGVNTAILGPNGSGKSTLLKLLWQEVRPEYRENRRVDEGIRLFGRERWNVWELRTRMGIVSHDLQVTYPPHVTGEQVVLSGHRSSLGVWSHQRFTEVERERSAVVLERLGMGSLAGIPFAAMSTGEQRRILLGRALVHDPEILILDEPTSGLDPKACFDYLDTMRELMRSGRTVFLVTHHVHEIPPEVERVILLERGRVVADGPKNEILTAERLSELFQTPVEVVSANGFYQLLPARMANGGGHPESEEIT